jgi:hypothetical protein
MLTDKPLLRSTILGSKNAMAIMMLFPLIVGLDIEVEGDIENGIRSEYYVRLYVNDNKVAKSTKSRLQSSVVKWEWKANNQM